MRVRFHLLVLFFSVISLSFLLISCQLLRPYQSPLTPTPDEWKTTYDGPETAQPVASESDSEEQIEESKPTPASEPCFEQVCAQLDNWWKVFQDPVLNGLEEQALDSSYTLWAALERVIEARAQARIERSPLFPAVTFNPSFTRTGSLFQNPFPNGNGGAAAATPTNISNSSSFSSSPLTPNTAASTPSVPSAFRFVQTQYLVPLNFSYEVDLWNQLHNNYYAAVFRAQASSQAYLSVLLSLTADVASTYFQIRGLDAQKAVILKNIEARKKTLEINQARYQAGIIVYLDVSRAEVELARAHSDLDDVIRLRGLQENLLGTLVGIPAPLFSVSYDPLVVPPPVIPTGIPSELLCRRPDIAESERLLAAAYNEIGVAYANFFPSLNLNAALGFSSPFAHNLFSWKARFWQVGWSIMQTVFDGGRTQANLDYYKALFSESMANYQERVLQAFQDVEDALVNLRQYAQQAQDLSWATKAARQTLELSQMRYNRGLVNYLDVVDAERSLLQTEQNAMIVLGNRYTSTVLLIRALGGGWGDGCGCACEE